MRVKSFFWIALLISCAFHISNAFAACAIFGDSIGVGLGQALKGDCSTSAEIGIISSLVAARVTPGDRWSIVSLGSNDFPIGLSPLMKSLSEVRVAKALDQVEKKVGKRLVLILPANDGRAIVKSWADKHGILTIGFEAGADGVHPRKFAYDAMAREIRHIIKS